MSVTGLDWPQKVSTHLFSRALGDQPRALARVGLAIKVFAPALLRTEKDILAFVLAANRQSGIHVHAANRILHGVGGRCAGTIRLCRFCRLSKEKAKESLQHPEDSKKSKNSRKEQQGCRS
jgi:hypothetical protein